jgi:UDP:flavonoid glycosyltransferase YjiC (YdhE family)
VSRFLFVLLPLAGHVNPAGAIGASLAAGGHQVAYAGSRARLRPHLGEDALIYPTGMRVYGGLADSGTASVRSLWQRFIVPFTRHTLAAVEQAVQAYQPDVLVVDQHALAGALIAQRHGLPWASLASSSMELTEPLRGLPQVGAWIDGHMTSLRAFAGLPADGPDLRFSPYLVIALTSAALTGGHQFPGHYALVGPAIAARPPAAGFPWHRLDPGRRKVLVTLGTMADENSAGFYPRAVQALAPLASRVQAIVVAPPGMITGPPEDLLVFSRVPQLELMPRLDAVICHGGMNTVCEALSFGVPLVIAPLTRDQPVNANQVVAAGAGLRVHFHRVRPQQLRAALATVLDDPSYRAAAAAIGASFAAAGGARAAAEYLERLALPPPG